MVGVPLLPSDSSVFDWNQCGVCTNPEVTKVYESKAARLSVSVAQDKDGKWRTGYDAMFSFSYGIACAPSCAPNRSACHTKEEAVQSVLRWFLAMHSVTGQMRKEIEKLIGEESLGGLFA